VLDTSAIEVTEQELWRNKLTDAETRYQEAEAKLQSLIAASERTEGARTHRIAAREEYLRVLGIFTDLVLRGKSPASDTLPLAVQRP
jgi:hypothetical protein